MKQTTFTQSGAPGRVNGWTNFSHWHSVDYIKIFNISLDLSTIYLLVLVGVNVPLHVAVTPSYNAITCFLELS